MSDIILKSEELYFTASGNLLEKLSYLAVKTDRCDGRIKILLVILGHIFPCGIGSIFLFFTVNDKCVHRFPLILY